MRFSQIYIDLFELYVLRSFTCDHQVLTSLAKFASWGHYHKV